MPLTHLRRVFVLLTLVAVSLVPALWAQEGLSSEPAKVTPVSEEIQSRMRALLPATLPAAAVPTASAEFYSPETLYRYMDGGADAFVLYDVEAMLHQDFKAGEVDVTVDLFDMGNSDNAFGIYASERSPSYDFIALGAEGYRNQGILNFLQGRYYVKLAGFGAGADAVLDQFARAISARIAGPAGFPPLLQKLPQDSRKPRSEQYLKKDPLGHSFLGPAYTVVYTTAKGEATLLVSVATNADDAQARLTKLADHFRKSGKCDNAPELGTGAIRASNSYEGSVVARAKGRYVLVLFNASAASEPVFTQAASQLE